ncbi:MAG: YjbE family putative metal transport protein [Hyphomonadaceae bacterium]
MESLIAEVGSLLAVVLIDLALSADNAVAVGLAAASLPESQRRQAVLWGVLLALALRILFGLVTVQLLHIPGLLLAGGLLLFWIAWRMWRDLAAHAQAVDEAAGAATLTGGPAKQPSFAHALMSIVIANIALSLDNVLAVAGIARNAPAIMAFGLILSVLLMGVAAAWIASLIDKHRWIGHVGIAAIVLAGVTMAWDDLSVLLPAYVAPPPVWLGGHAAVP